MNLRQWLSRHFQLQSLIHGEALLTCPRCNRPKLYFNVNKKVGYCHYDKCPWHVMPVFLADLVQVVGYGPSNDAGWTDLSDEAPDPTPAEIVLPEAAQPLCYMEEGTILTHYPAASEAVSGRGVAPEDQLRFNLHFDGLYVYIPVYMDDKIVSYIGRKAWWFETSDSIPRYNNASGSLTNAQIFNWNEARHWNTLTLVENTFVAIWLRKRTGSSSTFGAHLSWEQAHLISQGAFESVAFLWDEGSEDAAYKAMQMLKNDFGIPAAIGLIKGQPDDHELEWIAGAVEEIHTAATKGKIWVTLSK